MVARSDPVKSLSLFPRARARPREDNLLYLLFAQNVGCRLRRDCPNGKRTTVKHLCDPHNTKALDSVS